MTTDLFEQIVLDWLAAARHPRFNRPYTELVYQPMRELIQYLRSNDFQVYVVSGGGIEFMRPRVERIYGVPRAQVIGSSIKTVLAEQRGDPVLLRQPEVDSVDDGPRQAHRHPQIYRPPPHRRLRKLRRRSGDAEVDDGSARYQPRLSRPPHGRSTRVALRQRNSERQARRGPHAAKTHGWTVCDMQRD